MYVALDVWLIVICDSTLYSWYLSGFNSNIGMEYTVCKFMTDMTVK